MEEVFNPIQNYNKTRTLVGYVPRKSATQEIYDKIGFMSGLEVHQQLLTKEKLFCRCPAGMFQKKNEFDAEVIRHMRPTLSELGEYDGTALMEFKTKKEIIYRIKNETACTYDIDDTPPFPINKEALEIAVEISLLSGLNIVGEVHITRKQYLDGSIPTGFQRTAIIGVEGEIELPNKKIKLIQLSLEEDSCREISDEGHVRIYKTDRLGMPLIETVTYPDCVNPDEVKLTCDYIRFLNRSTGKVRTGMGAARQDVNVSCKGGSRVEIKGVAHTKWIPELTHNECFRQWALLLIRDELNKRIPVSKNRLLQFIELDYHSFKFSYPPVLNAKQNKFKLVAVNIPGFKGILSHFTQPGKVFADEISDRLKVIACLEKPNMIHSEEFEEKISVKDFLKIKTTLKSKDDDGQILFWGPEEDIKTAMETIEERCQMAYEGVPRETRKSFEDGTTVFERVLPGADRMYPDTDSAPIALSNKCIEEIQKRLPGKIIERYNQLNNWGIPKDTYTYIFKKNLFPLIERIVAELKIKPKYAGTFFGHYIKYVEGQLDNNEHFDYEKVYGLLKFVKKRKLDLEITKLMLPVIYEHPNLEFESVLTIINFKQIPEEEILSRIGFLLEKFEQSNNEKTSDAKKRWIMGQLRKIAVGNISMKKLSKHVLDGKDQR